MPQVDIDFGVGSLPVHNVNTLIDQAYLQDLAEYLLNAGIQIWVLTGDKTETAISIAFPAKNNFLIQFEYSPPLFESVFRAASSASLTARVSDTRRG